MRGVFLLLFTSLILIGVPVALLSAGIYGSFLFTFSIPLFWQIVIRKESIKSLGIKKTHIKSSIITGIITGCLFGFLGGRLLQLLGLTGYSFVQTDSIQLAIGKFKIEFPLMKELGYQLLTRSRDFKGLVVYLIFSIFIIGLGEEIFWRGFVQRKISSRIKKPLGILITSLLFALAHFYILAMLPINIGIILLILMGVAGAVWGYLFEKTGNVWGVALSHGIVAFTIWRYYFFVIVQLS